MPILFEHPEHAQGEARNRYPEESVEHGHQVGYGEAELLAVQQRWNRYGGGVVGVLGEGIGGPLDEYAQRPGRDAHII